MRSLFSPLILLVVLLAAQTGRARLIESSYKHDPAKCQDLESDGLKLINSLNELFGMDVSLTYIKESPFSKFSKRGIRIMDASAAHKDERGKETVQMPSPCDLDEELPSKEFWAFIVAHEFSHKIIDRKYVECGNVTEKFRPEQTPNVEGDVVTLYNINHMNIYLMAVKLLNHFKMDALKAVKDYGNYGKMIKGYNDAESLKTMRVTRNYLLKEVNSDFNKGSDFFSGEYFDGIDILEPMLKKYYPASTLIQDLMERVYSEENGCYAVKSRLRAKTLKAWKAKMADR